MKTKTLKFTLMLILTIAIAACEQQADTPAPIERTHMDENISPADDFFRYVNNGWLEANPMTDEYSRYGAFEEVSKLNDQQLNELITTIQKDKVAPTAATDRKSGISSIVPWIL